MSPLDGPDAGDDSDAAATAPEDPREAAARRQKAQRDFRLFLIVWIAVSLSLVAIWALTQPRYFWPVWPILGMGIATAFLAIDAFGGGTSRTERADRQADADLTRA